MCCVQSCDNKRFVFQTQTFCKTIQTRVSDYFCTFLESTLLVNSHAQLYFISALGCMILCRKCRVIIHILQINKPKGAILSLCEISVVNCNGYDQNEAVLCSLLLPHRLVACLTLRIFRNVHELLPDYTASHQKLVLFTDFHVDSVNIQRSLI